MQFTFIVLFCFVITEAIPIGNSKIKNTSNYEMEDPVSSALNSLKNNEVKRNFPDEATNRKISRSIFDFPNLSSDVLLPNVLPTMGNLGRHSERTANNLWPKYDVIPNALNVGSVGVFNSDITSKCVIPILFSCSPEVNYGRIHNVY